MSWKDDSKCRDLSPEEVDKLFWLGKGGSPMRARTFCMDCPVKKMCQNYALVHDEEGIWAGTTKKERDETLAQLPGLREKLKERARREGWLEEYRLETIVLAASYPVTIEYPYDEDALFDNYLNTLPQTGS